MFLKQGAWLCFACKEQRWGNPTGTVAHKEEILNPFPPGHGPDVNCASKLVIRSGREVSIGVL